MARLLVNPMERSNLCDSHVYAGGDQTPRYRPHGVTGSEGRILPPCFTFIAVNAAIKTTVS